MDIGITELGKKTMACSVHGEFRSVGRTFIGNEVWSTCPKCKEIEERRANDEESEKRRRAEAKKIDDLMNKAGIIKRYRGINLLNFEPTPNQVEAFDYAKEFIKNFDEMARKGQTLIYCGTLGTGKTRLASAMLQSLGSGRYVRAVDISRDVRHSFNGNSALSERDVVDGFVEPELLVIDEVGVQSGGNHEKLLITDIIDRRYGELKPTVILSNLPESELSHVFGARAWDRLMESCLICPMIGESLRGDENGN